MSEYINKEKVKDIVRSGISTDTEADKEYVCSLIDSIPSVDVRPNIHARWIELPKAFNSNELPCKCSNPKCGEVLSFMNGYPKSKFCPSCGAIMDREEPEEIIGIGNADKMVKLVNNLMKAMDGEPTGEKGTE